MQEEIKILTDYNKIWFNQIVAVIILCSSLVIFSLGSTTKSIIMFVGLFILSILLMLNNLKKQKEFYNE